MSKGVEIDTDKNRLDVSFIHEFISNSYWAAGRSIEDVQTCIDHSLNFGVYLAEKQIGYGRLVTDYTQFAYLMDVFIDKNHRGKGYSKQLMKYMLELKALSAVKVWRLATTDAQGLYAQFGFSPLAHPEKQMELVR
ncbi:MAG: GNAT family N-acetyltransferase [Bacteroidota bacterium]